MQDFLIQYLSSVFAGITLGLVGFGVYKKTITQRNNSEQKNSDGSNVLQNIQTQNNNYHFPNIPKDRVNDPTTTGDKQQ